MAKALSYVSPKANAVWCRTKENHYCSRGPRQCHYIFTFEGMVRKILQICHDFYGCVKFVKTLLHKKPILLGFHLRKWIRCYYHSKLFIVLPLSSVSADALLEEKEITCVFKQMCNIHLLSPVALRSIVEEYRQNIGYGFFCYFLGEICGFNIYKQNILKENLVCFFCWSGAALDLFFMTTWLLRTNCDSFFPLIWFSQFENL